MLSSKRARVLLLIPHLGGGGAERVVELLARFLDRSKYEVHVGLVTVPIKGLPGHYAFENIRELNASRVRASLFKTWWLIWNLRPEIVLCGMAHLNLLVLLLRPVLPRRTRVLVRQNGPVSATLETGRSSGFMRLVYGVAYRRADLVICQSESMKEEIQQELRIEEGKLAVLPNPVDADLIRSAVQRRNADRIQEAPHLVAIGRLAPEKGLDILLKAFESVSRRIPELRLTIAGSGPCEDSLKAQAEKLGISSRVHFCGYVADPAALLRDASLFVLSSRSEGIPNALLEAATGGLPIVTTPASQGLTDLLADKEGVWVANEISAPALKVALEAALARLSPGERYSHPWVARFDVASAIPAYEAAIDRIIEGHSR